MPPLIVLAGIGSMQLRRYWNNFQKDSICYWILLAFIFMSRRHNQSLISCNPV
jgi:hypothetical protein